MPTTFCLQYSVTESLTSYYSKVLNKRAASIITILDFVQPTQLIWYYLTILKNPYTFYFHDFFLPTRLFGTLGYCFSPSQNCSVFQLGCLFCDWLKQLQIIEISVALPFRQNVICKYDHTWKKITFKNHLANFTDSVQKLHN